MRDSVQHGFLHRSTGWSFADIYVDVAFIGTNGCSVERGLTTPDPAEAAVKRAMISAARRSVLLADHTKIGNDYFARFGTLDDLDLIITDSAVEGELIMEIEADPENLQLAAEYRALRASVLRLWMDAGDPKESSLEDVIRFDEAIDQALAESVDFFSAEVDQARNLFFGMLGHDMRSPLQTIQMTAHYLSALNAGSTVSDAAARLTNSGTRMKELLDDLLDFNRTKFGFGINIAPTDIDAALLVAEELKLVRGAHPNRVIELEVAGDVRGYWDGPRLRRLLGNLLLNAIKYGAADSTIRVSVEDQGADVRLAVRNGGSAIDPAILDDIFEPLKRGIDYESASDADSSLGLGLYIAREIAKAHGGEISVRSDANETMFSVRLPRRKSS